MDKYEYQVCADQIKSLIKEHRFTEAMDIADTIDWRRVKSFSMLCTVSEIYKVTKHYSEARDILLLAYERYPDRANVVYALCELAIKLDDISESVEYYKEYVRLKPHDTNRYVLLYKIYEAQEVPLEEKISLLEEFKKAEYSEKWAYELALLYHKDGQETRCVETCDELVLWFGEGPYVRKALELKMQHAPLTKEQQRKYDGVYEAPAIPKNDTDETVHIYETQSMNAYANGASPYETAPLETGAVPSNEAPSANNSYGQQPSYQDIHVQPVSTDKFSTINLQQELAKNMEEFYAREKNSVAAPYYGSTQQLYEPSQEQFMQKINQAGAVEEPVAQYGQPYYQAEQMQQAYMQPDYGQQMYANDGQQAYMNGGMPTYMNDAQQAYMEQGQQMPLPSQMPYEGQMQQNIYDMNNNSVPMYEQPVDAGMAYNQMQQNAVSYEQPVYEQPVYEQPAVTQVEEKPAIQPEQPVVPNNEPAVAVTEAPVYNEAANAKEDPNVIKTVEKKPIVIPSYIANNGGSGVPRDLEDKLREGRDGQMTMSLPDVGAQIDEQVPGQIDISDFMSDWEAKKKNAMEQRNAQIKAKSLEQTSDIMSQLVGVIPGLDTITETEEQVADNKAPEEAPKSQEEVLRDDKKGVVTKTTIASPSFDRDNGVKRSESGSVINGPLKSSITGQIPDILPNADVASKGDILPSGRMLTLDEQYGGNLAQIREIDADIARRTGEIPPVEEDLVSDVNPDYGEAEEIEDIEQPEIEDIDDGKSEPEELPNEEDRFIAPLNTGELPEVTSESFKVETPETVADEVNISSKSDSIEAGDESNGAVSDAVEQESEAIVESSEDKSDALSEQSVEAEEDSSEEEEQVEDDEPITYPYDVDDMGEVEDLEDIEQPDDVDDMLKTRPIPVEEIEARQRYEAGLEEEDSEAKKAVQPGYVDRFDVRSRREFDDAEYQIFGRYEGIESLKAQIVDVMDDMSMEARRGNVIVMGSELYGRKAISIDVVKAIQMMDSSFSGKVAKISGEALNKKNIPVTLSKLSNGALIVENAGGLTPVTINAITESLQASDESILVVLEDERDNLEPLLNGCPETKQVFDSRITMDDFNDNDLVEYAKGYAREQGYSIDDMGALALHTRISDMQTFDHAVSIDEAMEIIDNAIRHVDKKNMSHFMDVLLAKRYDEYDYIVLREKDFIV